MKYTIYQITLTCPNSRYIKFASYDFMMEFKLPIKKENYKEVWTGEIITKSSTTDGILEELFCKFQGFDDEAYKGHSMSVSDVVVLDGVPYYCDSAGFKELKEF